ncbi:conserved hypothetical protein [Planktothrix serta PCC 8927]|uniref:CRISPR type III-associated protein domain-containing protein n=1 Tax=Planktothrix serta PCC 8927 TaxID=671068 RepID=A0A7Z9BMG5_9CYAN|nr:RAMP superfamily CRISPR-associated protein [Planktothrix serta]VXD17619.1 conserved hypothetical protein [Planktothrix serta PCC 8927]
MTYNKPTSRQSNSAASSRSNFSDGEQVPKPYSMVSLPKPAPQRKPPVGQEQFKLKRLSGKISLRLTVKTATFIASGVVAMGTDVSSLNKNIPLIKVAVSQGEKIIIPGSSLKGVVRSTYEAITSSCLCKTRARKENIPEGYSECKDKTKLCPACQVFGAMGWQGLISFQDAVAETIKPSVGFMPSLYAPRTSRKAYFLNGKVAGRKFYYHAIKAVDKGQRGIPVQQAGAELTLTTQLRFMNLTEAELGTLLIVLGQDQNNYFALKVGGGKPIGMGTMTVEVTEIEHSENVKNRYLSYTLSEDNTLTGDKLKQFIQKNVNAAKTLVQADQLKQLKAILEYPTKRTAPEGMY